jgi:hypothetical protein
VIDKKRGANSHAFLISHLLLNFSFGIVASTSTGCCAMRPNQSRRNRRAAKVEGVNRLPDAESNLEARSAQSERLLGDLITPAELAAEFGVCLETLKRWHRTGKAPPKGMLGRFPYYSKTTVRAWMQSGGCAA